MKLTKKIFYSLGATSTALLPIATVLACGDNSAPEKTAASEDSTPSPNPADVLIGMVEGLLPESVDSIKPLIVKALKTGTKNLTDADLQSLSNFINESLPEKTEEVEVTITYKGAAIPSSNVQGTLNANDNNDTKQTLTDQPGKFKTTFDLPNSFESLNKKQGDELQLNDLQLNNRKQLLNDKRVITHNVKTKFVFVEEDSAAKTVKFKIIISKEGEKIATSTPQILKSILNGTPVESDNFDTNVQDLFSFIKDLILNSVDENIKDIIANPDDPLLDQFFSSENTKMLVEYFNEFKEFTNFENVKDKINEDKDDYPWVEDIEALLKDKFSNYENMENESTEISDYLKNANLLEEMLDYFLKEEKYLELITVLIPQLVVSGINNLSSTNWNQLLTGMGKISEIGEAFGIESNEDSEPEGVLGILLKLAEQKDTLSVIIPKLLEGGLNSLSQEELISLTSLASIFM